MNGEARIIVSESFLFRADALYIFVMGWKGIWLEANSMYLEAAALDMRGLPSTLNFVSGTSSLIGAAFSSYTGLSSTLSSSYSSS